MSPSVFPHPLGLTILCNPGTESFPLHLAAALILTVFIWMRPSHSSPFPSLPVPLLPIDLPVLRRIFEIFRYVYILMCALSTALDSSSYSSFASSISLSLSVSPSPQPFVRLDCIGGCCLCCCCWWCGCGRWAGPGLLMDRAVLLLPRAKDFKWFLFDFLFARCQIYLDCQLCFACSWQHSARSQSAQVGSPQMQSIAAWRVHLMLTYWVESGSPPYAI